jgi:1,4-dihydroxy-2-naphthoyl-CoA hydrolase
MPTANTALWKRTPTLEQLNAMAAQTMMEHLAITFTEITPTSLKAKMPVDHRTHQPRGLLHGGASCVLSETLGSTAANLAVDPAQHSCVGLEINANHLRSATTGWVEGETTALHIGRSTQVWETRITQQGKLLCVSRLTLAVLETQ